MKSKDQIVKYALEKEMKSVPKNMFLCTKCLRVLRKDLKASHGGWCKNCWARIARERWKDAHTTKTCIKCRETGTNFTGENNICRKCRQVYRKNNNKTFARNLGEKLLILWKADYDYERAIQFIREGNRVWRNDKIKT